MKNLTTLDKEGFLDVLACLNRCQWAAHIDHHCIHLRRIGSATIFSPITAVYRELTGIELHRGSFWHGEITERLGLDRWDILEITYAEICCACNGKEYDRKLRRSILDAVAPLIRSDGIISYLDELK